MGRGVVVSLASNPLPHAWWNRMSDICYQLPKELIGMNFLGLINHCGDKEGVKEADKEWDWDSFCKLP